MEAKHWIIFGVIVAAVVGGLIYMSPKSTIDVDDIGKAGSGKILAGEERNGNIGDHVFGNKDAKVILVEYGDFQCNPGCKTFHENITPILQDETYKSKIAFVYRNWPISSIHPNANAAAASAEAAGLQDKYWEMWDALFTNQAEWSAASAADRNGFFEKYATAVGVKLEKFRTDYASEAVSKKVKFDQALGKVAGVTGTPTLFINGKQVDGGKINSTEGMKTQIDEALKEVE